MDSTPDQTWEVTTSYFAADGPKVQTRQIVAPTYVLEDGSSEHDPGWLAFADASGIAIRRISRELVMEVALVPPVTTGAAA